MRQVILGVCPSKSNNYTPSGNKMFKKEHIKEYEKSFAIQYRLWHKRIEGKFKLTMDVYFPSEQHDIDGVLKVVLDCLQKIGAVKNDKMCYRLERIDKHIDKINPRIEFEVNEL